MTDNSLNICGQCRCGKIKFEVNSKPLITMVCHCTGCQKMTASAFSLSSLFPSSAFTVTLGDPVIGGPHGATRHYCCDHCKSWLFTRPEGMDEFVNVRSSMLEDARLYKPFVEMYLDEKLEWAVTGAVHGFNKFPSQEMFSTLLEEYVSNGK